MKGLIPDYLTDILDEVRDVTDGEVPDYIPALAEADPAWLGVVIHTTTGNTYAAGDDLAEFTIQSVSKPFTYALAMQELGIDAVREVVGMEPSGEAFNEMSLEKEAKRPFNPMINAGAIAVNQLINGTDSDVDDRVEVIRQFFSKLAGRELEIDASAVDGEMEGADRNLSIAHMLRSYDIIVDEAHDAVISYTRQCSLRVTLHDLAVMAATLANGGIQPVTGERLLSEAVCRQTMAVMASCGMYDAAGRWMARVGIPAKSGVSGAVIGMLPGQLGIAALSPRLDGAGNSVRGVKIFENMSTDMGLHLMSTENIAGAHAVRSINRVGEDTIVTIQGMVNFIGAEAILGVLNQHNFRDGRIVLDVSRMVESNTMGRRMLKEGLRRLREEGHEIGVIDPDGGLKQRLMDDGSQIPLVNENEG
ncbi:glutaminase [Corynebacterium yudongzhengii]|uniref:Glutaminase n=1 Tax=Corynebacterium yudongzhengii TaxID=2080740 RepID=A0A2U1T8R9_9CORY|nr:glutaminase [Corynebacterium yudongzhengii]AWB82537.1 glutaminase [Corynebacterium yudongzhengii]PWC02407.1 glutaminase [Corynebacterium yudongzhengii]